MNDSLSHVSNWTWSSHFPDLLYEQSLSSVLCSSRQCLWHSFWNKHAHTSSVLYPGNQWHSNICSAALRKRSCSTLSDRDAASERSASTLCRELMKHSSSLAIFHLQIGTALPQERNTCLKKGLLIKNFYFVLIYKKKPKRNYLSGNKIIIFFLNNNNVYHW